MSDRIHTLSGYIHEYQRSVHQPEQFWSRIADSFHWKKRWEKTVEWNFEEPKITWFKGAKLNITENILEKNLFTLGDKPAIIWEPNEPGDENQIISYRQLYEKVNQFSNAMKAKGVKKGDRVIIYMPMVPEAAIAMLACARLGRQLILWYCAGFSCQMPLADRIMNMPKAKMVLTFRWKFQTQAQNQFL